MFHFLKRTVETLGKKKIFKYALITNTVFGVVLRSVGDITQQKLEKKYAKNIFNKKQDDFTTDWIRTRNMAISGIVIGPLSYWWYSYLDKIPGKTFQVVCKKILLDQLFAATVFNFLFIVTISLLAGFTIKESWKEFRQKFLYIYIVDWIIWAPSQAINFLFIPKQYRVAFVNVILVCWNIFLSSCYPK